MLTEDKAVEILIELIRSPGSVVSDIPITWDSIIRVSREAFAPAVEPPVKKKRRRQANPNIGWPAGVKRADYRAWKEAQAAKGQTENINPQEYKRVRDLGMAGVT
jgi:hypothetical protein